MFSITFLFFCTLVISTYTANLATILVETSKTIEVATMASLAQKGERVCVRSKTAYGRAMKSDYGSKIKFIDVSGSLLDALYSGECKAAVNSEYIIVEGHNTDCTGLTRGVIPFWDYHQLGWGMDKSMITLSNAISEEIVKLAQSKGDGGQSFMESLTEKYFDPGLCYNSEANEDDIRSMQLGIKHLEVPFVAMAAVVFLAFIIEKIGESYAGNLYHRQLIHNSSIVNKESKSIDFDGLWQLMDSSDSEVVGTQKVKSFLMQVYMLLHGTKMDDKDLDIILKRLDPEYDGGVEREDWECPKAREIVQQKLCSDPETKQPSRRFRRMGPGHSQPSEPGAPTTTNVQLGNEIKFGNLSDEINKVKTPQHTHKNSTTLLSYPTPPKQHLESTGLSAQQTRPTPMLDRLETEIFQSQPRPETTHRLQYR